MADKEIIKVLDYISEKLGIAVDWTTENVLPYAKDVIGDYVTYEIVSNAFGLAISVSMVIISALLLRWLSKSYTECKATEKSTALFDYYYYSGLQEKSYTLNDLGRAVSIVAPCITIICLPLSISIAIELLKWCITPEVALFSKMLRVLGGN